MSSQKGLEDKIEEFCDRVDNIENDIKQLINSMPESYFIHKPWPQSRKHYLNTISAYCKREGKELPKGFSRKTLRQLKGMYWGVFKEDGKKRYHYRNFLNDYENELAKLCSNQNISKMIEHQNYEGALKELLGEFTYKNLEKEKAEEYSCLIKESCEKKDKELKNIFYTLSTRELEKKYSNAICLRELLKREQNPF